jgi:hypothetical protein
MHKQDSINIPIRIQRYIDSFIKFLKKYMCNKIVYDQVINIDILMISIIYLTIYSNILINKNITRSHGYYISYSLMLLLLLIRSNENDNDSIKIIQTDLIKMIEFQNNLLSIDTNINNIISNIFTTCSSEMNKLEKITHEQITKNDLYRYKFDDTKTLENYKKMRHMSYDDISNYTKNTYGKICIILFKSLFLITNIKNNENILKDTSNALGFILKILIDIKNIESDINTKKIETHNIVLNLGIMKSYEIYKKNKEIFIENCMLMDVYGTTLNEIIQLIDNMITLILDKVEININKSSDSFISVK